MPMSTMHEVKTRIQDGRRVTVDLIGYPSDIMRASKTGVESSLHQEVESTHSLFSDFAISCCRSSFRLILPERVFGSSSTNSIARGYL